jgi:hypothetical protein
MVLEPKCILHEMDSRYKMQNISVCCWAKVFKVRELPITRADNPLFGLSHSPEDDTWGWDYGQQQCYCLVG